MRLLFLSILVALGLHAQAQIINNYAGTGVCCGWGPENGPATTALFTSINGLTIDDSGNVYISDLSTVRKINVSGYIRTIAGTTGLTGPVAGYSGDNGPATAALMQNGVADVAFDNIGNIYICDSGNNVVRKVNASGTITTFAGNGIAGATGDGTAATAAELNGPTGIAIDRAGNIYIGDYNNKKVRIVNTSGTIKTYAGTGTAGYRGDGGMATAAELSHPSHLAFDNAGNLYFSDFGNVVVRKVNTTGIISTYAGTGVSGYSGDGGAATAAKLNIPGGLIFDADNNLFIGDGGVIRMVTPAGIIKTVAGTDVTGYAGDGGPATTAQINNGVITMDYSGNLYLNQLSNAIRTVPGVGAINSAPAFNLGPVQSYTVCINSTANSINSLLPVRDVNTGQTETWRIYTSPVHGALGGFPYSALSTGGIILPAGLTYTPSPGFSGSDEFTIQVYDGFSVDTTHINITVNPLSTVGAISGTTDICTGSVALYMDATPGGFWTSSNTSIAVVGSTTGVVTGMASGSATITFTLNLCGTATTTHSVVIAPGTAINPVTGTTTICAGGTTSLGDITSGGTWESSNTTIATVGTGGNVTGVSGGTSTIIYTTMQACGAATATATVTVNTLPATGSIYGITTICTGTLTTLGETVSGGTWSSANSAVVSIGSISGAATGVSVGSALVSYAVTNTCGTAYATSIVYVNAPLSVGAISGSSFICAGTATTLTDPTSGGTWSSANPAIASIGSGSGIMSGITPGTTTISYVVTNSCGPTFVTMPVTIGSTSSLTASTGTSTFCQGTTSMLSNTTLGGAWTSSNTSVATVGTGGVVTGVSAGTATIVYTATLSCGVASTGTTVTINPAPNAGTIVGTSGICMGSFATLTDASSGGTWSSGNTSIATVGSITGIVTGIATGTAVISYSVTNGCGTASATSLVTIGTAATIAPITGISNICPGSSITLSDATSGGTWSSGNSGIATIGSTGMATGVAAGHTTIIYTLTLSCGTGDITTSLTVNAAPSLISSLTPPAVCSGSLFSYVPVCSYGGATFTWARGFTSGISNPTASGSGDIAETLYNTTAVNVGVTYSYTIMALGCTNHQNIRVTIYPTPLLSSATTDTICSGAVFNYAPASATTGVSYTWSRSAVTGISPSTATGTGNISEALFNSTASPVTVTYLYALSASGCTSSANLQLLVTPQAAITSITTESPSSVCSQTNNQNFGAASAPGSGVTYSWSAVNADVWAVGSTSQYCLVNFPNSGTALVILSASVGSTHCVVNDTVSVAVSSAVSSTAAVIFSDEQFAYLDNTDSTYQWGYDNVSTLDSTLVPGATFQSYLNSSPDFTDNYYWVITTKNGCMQKTYYNSPLGVQSNTVTTGILKVYPDPAGNMVNVDLKNYQNNTYLEIFNIYGQKVRSQLVTSSTVHFDITNLPAGYYLVNCIQNGMKTGNTRFIKN